MTIGERIKHLRKEHKMTQSDLAEAIGVVKASVQKYECGGVTNLKTETIEHMAKLFNVSPAYLMGWDEEYNSKELAKEVKLIEQLQETFGYVGVELHNIFSQLNDEGKRKVLFYAEDIYEVNKYKGTEDNA